MSWGFTQSINPNGYGMFFIKVWENDQGNAEDITFFRDVPTQIQQLDFSDPFSDATAVISMPQVTGFDGPSGDTWWLKEFVNVDVYWVPAISGGTNVINPTTQAMNMQLDEANAVAIWEGFVISIQPSLDGVQIQCQGALWQLDRYYSKPLNPYKPKSVESMIERYFDPQRRGLWTQPLRIDWPDDWSITYDAAAKAKFEAQGDRYVPTGMIDDQNWTGYVTRNTGSWEKLLTGYIQRQLGILYAEPAEGDPLLSKGDQWTIYKEEGRQPYMTVRKQTKTPTLVAWYGQPGVEARLTRDGNVVSNVVYGKGTGIDGNQWDQRVYPGNVPWNTYTPIAWDTDTYVGDEPNFPIIDLYDGYDANNERLNAINVIERYVTDFPDGVALDDAQVIASNWIERDKEPGWMGTIDLKVDLRDPSDNAVSKWMIKAGDVIHLKGFYGTGASEVPGTNVFHVSQVTMRPMDNSVTLTVDTKFRDLLSVEEAMTAGRDSLSVIKSLQVGKRSAMIEDLVVPWSNTQGSGFIPRQSKDFVKTDLVFPYTGNTTAVGQRPKDIFKTAWLPGGTGRPVQGDRVADTGGSTKYASLRETANSAPLYVPVRAGASNKSKRWAIVPVLMAQAGQISKIEFCAYDQDGEIAPVEYHVSYYSSNNMFISNMPKDITGDNQYAALWDGAFETLDPETNLPWADGPDYHAPPNYFVIGWGTYDRPAGYSPGTKDGGDSTAQTPTGQLIDGATWDFNFVGQNREFPASGRTANGQPIATSGVMGSVAIYAQIPSWFSSAQKAKYEWVYFVGRFFRDYTVGGV